MSTLFTPKYLGLILDDQFRWHEHINFLKTKLSRALGMLYKIRNFVERKTLILVMHSIFVTHIRYGIICWGRADKTIKKPIETLLDRAVRCINFYRGFENKTNNLYYKIKLLKVEDLFNLEIGKFMFKLNNNLLPKPFKPYFKSVNSIHSHNTRNVDKLFIPRLNKKIGQKSLSFLGSKTWNNITKKIRGKKTLKILQKNMRNHY